MPISEFHYRRRVEFAETDLVGVVHFSWIARYMEEAEHALWRAAGLTIAPRNPTVLFPRVGLTIDFKAPLMFEEEFDVHVRIDAMSARTIRYSHTLTRDGVVIATGTMAATCVTAGPPPFRAVDLPPEVTRGLSPKP
jgi:acyl-CoA thioester hydrolase